MYSKQEGNKKCYYLQGLQKTKFVNVLNFVSQTIAEEITYPHIQIQQGMQFVIMMRKMKNVIIVH